MLAKIASKLSGVPVVRGLFSEGRALMRAESAIARGEAQMGIMEKAVERQQALFDKLPITGERAKALRNATSEKLAAKVNKVTERMIEDVTGTGGLRGLIRRNKIKSAVVGLGGSALAYKAFSGGDNNFDPSAVDGTGVAAPEMRGAQAAVEDFTKELALQQPLYEANPGYDGSRMQINAATAELAGRAQELGLASGRA